MCKRCDDYAADWEWVECPNVPACGWFGAVEVLPGQHNTCPKCGHRVKDKRQCEGCFQFPCVCEPACYINELCEDAAFKTIWEYNAVMDAADDQQEAA